MKFHGKYRNRAEKCSLVLLILPLIILCVRSFFTKQYSLPIYLPFLSLKTRSPGTVSFWIAFSVFLTSVQTTIHAKTLRRLKKKRV